MCLSFFVVTWPSKGVWYVTYWYQRYWFNIGSIWAKGQREFNKFVVTEFQSMLNLGKAVKFSNCKKSLHLIWQREGQIDSFRVEFDHGKLSPELPWWPKKKIKFLAEKENFRKIMKL